MVDTGSLEQTWHEKVRTCLDLNGDSELEIFENDKVGLGIVFNFFEYDF